MKRVRGADVHVGDTLKMNDWRLHIRSVDHESNTCIGVAELDFALHLDNDKLYDVLEVGEL